MASEDRARGERGGAMSIRTKITLFVLFVGLAEAILLGSIGYNSVTSVSRNAAELRRISSAIEGARALNVSLSRLSDPGDLLLRGDAAATGRFSGMLDDLELQVASCSATACHGYRKRPPEMADQVMKEIRTIRANGVRILSARAPNSPPPLKEWIDEVDAPSRRVSQETQQMAETLMSKAREIESSNRKADRAAILLVAFTTLSCVLVSVALCHPIARGIARPLERLADQSRGIAEGDLSIRARETGPREVVQLAGSFNRMLDDLSSSRQQLLSHQEQLEREVEARIVELRNKDEELKRSGQLAGVGLIAGSVAHDLNNPLTNLLLNAEALEGSIPAEDERRRVVEDLTADARRCRQIAGEIRAMSRQAELEKIPCAVEDLVRETVRLVRFKWEPRKIVVNVDLPPSPPPCRGSSPHLLQMLMNLVDNAIDATPDGGQVRVGVKSREDGLVFEIEDHGPGIPREKRDSLFKPLFTTKARGTGLGLAISRRIAEQHGGTIEFETSTAEDGAARRPGTVFRVRIPQEETDGHDRGGDSRRR